MRIEQLMSKLFGYSAQTYFNWKKDKDTTRPIMNLMDKYFTKEELEEFLETGTITKMDAVAGLSLEDLKMIRENKEVIVKLQEVKQLLQGSHQC